MPYIDSSGNIVESKKSVIGIFADFFFFILCFLKTLFGPFFGGSGSSSEPTSYRGNGESRGGTYRRWPGSGGPGGPSYGDETRPRRPIGRLPRSSGMKCPPMGGGGS